MNHYPFILFILFAGYTFPPPRILSLLATNLTYSPTFYLLFVFFE